MLNRYDFASSRFEISGPNTSRNDKNIPCSPHFHLAWQFCRTNVFCNKSNRILALKVITLYSLHPPSVNFIKVVIFPKPFKLLINRLIVDTWFYNTIDLRPVKTILSID